MGNRLGSALRLPDDDFTEVVDRLVRFINSEFRRANADSLVVSLSGGLDSSVAAALSALAVGGRRVTGLSMPEAETYNHEDMDDARRVARKYGIRFRVHDISHLEGDAKTLLGVGRRERIAWGNVKARLRAMICYYYANVSNGLVVGTGDKSELMLGYFTKYGDGATDIEPLGDLYKTSVRQLAVHLRLPRRIHLKKSTPNLWVGQTAERELGLDYEKIDKILWGLERWMTSDEIAKELSLSLASVVKIRERWLATEHKRRLPLTPKLGFRTVGIDFRLPRNP